VLSARGRRDPFTKALTPTKRAGTIRGPKGDNEVKVHVDAGKLPEELAKAGKLIDDLERAIKEGSGRAEGYYQRFIRVYRPLRDLCKGDPVKLNQLDGYKARAESIYGGAERLVQRARSLLGNIEDHYNALNEKGVETALGEIRTMRNRPEFFQDERVIEMERIMREAEQKLAQTRARIELQKKELVLTGTVFQANTVNEGVAVGLDVSGGRLDFNEPVKVTYHVTYAVINKKLYGRGDSVDGVIVEDIRPHGITVSYRGEVREVLLKARRETK
jgi:hypothetical protein